ncbi:MAG: WbuC family cupin fold metalloprotein [Kiritimatiellae bacterium]|nr:WbuC family cupin fold metalloprotein [Kiritimatiellia bacterium]MDW8458696.1 WbuC family cupin fold metalloprotein [Verrucomicrobiota bacterium]
MKETESPMNEISPAVLAPLGEVIRIGSMGICRVKIEAVRSARGRARINAHPGPDAAVQEMLIALHRGTYLRPHKHIDKSESFHVIEGCADVILFDDEGGIFDIVELGPPGGDRCFYYRQSVPRFHTLIIHSDMFVIHETTNGPFSPERTLFAPWAPEESDPKATAFMGDLQRRAFDWLAQNRR